MIDKPYPIINLTRCDRCGKCIDLCPEDALLMTDSGPAFKQPVICTYCLTCESVCPQSAIRAPLIITWAPEDHPFVFNH